MMRVAIRVDGSTRMGGGHVMRCLTLADELNRIGADTVFVSAVMPQPLRARLDHAGHTLRDIDNGHVELACGRERWEEASLSADAQREDASRTAEALDGAFDWIIVDHYLLDRVWEEAVRAAAARVMVIDDLANRRHDCDLLLDQTFGRVAGDYVSLVPEGARLLLGARYALLRPEFVLERPDSLARRRCPAPVDRIVISLGASDLDGITAAAVDEVRRAAPDCSVDVVLGSGAPSLHALGLLASDQPSLQLHVDTSEMAPLLRQADLAIGAFGTTSWERCCLGVPSIGLILAENQRFLARSLGEVEASIAVASIAELPLALRELLDDATRRLKMVAASAAITSGNGASLVAQAICGLDPAPSECPRVNIRPAALADAETLWLWRNDPAARAASQKSDPVPWQDHIRWLELVLTSEHRHLFIAECGAADLGVVRFDCINEKGPTYEVSINLQPQARGGGNGRAVLAAGCAHFLRQIGSARLEAVIHEKNPASRRIFEALGFRYSGPMAESSFQRYVQQEYSPLVEA